MSTHPPAQRSAQGSQLCAGKVALVTGAASGIGRACALALAREGAAAIVVSDVDASGGEETARLAAEAGATTCFQTTDVSDEHQVRALVALCVERYGRLDCAINNAGISGPMAPLHEIQVDDWNRTLQVNLTGVFLCMKHEIPQMHAQGGGAIVNTASGAGLIATPGMSPYCASKHAILGITKTAAVENARSGVRINAVCPGSTDTPMLRASMDTSPQVEKMILASQPGGRLGRAEEIAEASIWLCSDRASFVSGESMLVDGGAVAR
jgi:NAD(P)-dependent dehydrogenase (short-subunit alcohol dehydrogenase family)